MRGEDLCRGRNRTGGCEINAGYVDFDRRARLSLNDELVAVEEMNARTLIRYAERSLDRWRFVQCDDRGGI